MLGSLTKSFNKKPEKVIKPVSKEKSIANNVELLDLSGIVNENTIFNSETNTLPLIQRLNLELTCYNLAITIYKLDISNPGIKIKLVTDFMDKLKIIEFSKLDNNENDIVIGMNEQETKNSARKLVYDEINRIQTKILDHLKIFEKNINILKD